MCDKVKLKVIISDIDGTLLNNESRISETNLTTLRLLKKQGILIVLATGRSLFSAKKALDENNILDLIDYLIFSTGAAIYNVKNDQIFNVSKLEDDEITEIENYLDTSINLDYMIQAPIPDNHWFCYKKNNRFETNPDFYNRIQIYKDSILRREQITDSATQFIAIVPENIESIFKEVQRKFQNKFSIVKTTSPLNQKSLWIEIFPCNVSKSTASINLLKLLNLNIDNLITIGNDFNDMDLLKIGKRNYLLENAPEELKKIVSDNSNYKDCIISPSNINDGFSKAVKENIIL